MNILTKSKRIIKSTILGASALVLLAAPGAAFAQDGGHGGRGGDGNRQGKSSQHRRDDNGNKHGWNKDNDKHRRAQEIKQKSCDERQQALNQRAASALDRSTRKLNGLNIVFGGIQTYVATNEITVENYDALNAAATNDQAAATAAVNAIQAPQLNCDDQAASSGSANAQLSETIHTAKRTLNVYRQDVMRLFEAALGATND